MVSLTRKERHQLAKHIQLQGNLPWKKESVTVKRSVPTASGSKTKPISNPGQFKPTFHGTSLAKLEILGNNHRKEVLFSDEPDVNKAKVKEAWATFIVQLPHGQPPKMNQKNLQKFAASRFIGINIGELVQKLNVDEMAAFVNGKSID